jgi:hypothetical protein
MVPANPTRDTYVPAVLQISVAKKAFPLLAIETYSSRSTPLSTVAWSLMANRG